MEGSAHARWDEQVGPCVSPLDDARMSMGSASAVNGLPGGSSLDGLLSEAPAADGTGSLLEYRTPSTRIPTCSSFPLPGRPTRPCSRP